MRRILTIKEAAKLIEGLTEYRIRQMVKSGQFPCFMAGKKYLIDEQATSRLCTRRYLEKYPLRTNRHDSQGALIRPLRLYYYKYRINLQKPLDKCKNISYTLKR